MAYDGSIRINTKINADGFKQGASAIGTQAKNLSARVGNVGRSITGLIAKIGVLAGVTGMVVFGKQCIQAASDLQEVQNVVDVAFGSMSQKAEDFASTALEQFGLSEYSAKKMSSTYMAMGKSMGLSMEQASDMAISISKRTADISSFYNLTAEEAAIKLKSIYTGETETLKDLGIVMTQANLKQFALSQGITKSYDAMSQGEQVALRYKFVMQASNDAAGDFARTSGSWANQTRVLSENFMRLKTVLGSYLITALTPVIQGLNTIIGRLVDIATAAKDILSSVFGIEFQEMTASAESTESGLDGVSDGLDNVADSAEKAAKKQEKVNTALADFDKQNKLSAKDSTSSDSSSTSSTGAVDSILGDISSNDSPIKKAGTSVDNLKTKMDSLLKTISPVTTAFKNLYNDGLKKLINFNYTTLKDFYNDCLKPLGTFMLSENGLPKLFSITNDLLNKINWTKLRQTMKKFYTVLEDLGELTWTALMDFYEKFLVPIASWTLNSALPKLVDCLKSLVDKFKSSKAIKNLSDLWTILSNFTIKIGTGLIDFVTAMAKIALDYILGLDWKSFNDGLKGLLNVIATVAINVGKGIVDFFDGIAPVATWLTNTFILLLDGLFSALNWLVDSRLTQAVLQGIGTGLATVFFAIEGIKIVSGVASFISGIGTSVGGLITTLMANPVTTAAGLLALVIGGLEGFSSAMRDSGKDEWYKDFDKAIDDLNAKIGETKNKFDEIDTAYEDSSTSAQANAEEVKILADKYYELYNKTGKTKEEMDAMKTLASTMSAAIGPNSEYGIAIDSTTGLITTQKDEVYKNIKAMQDQALEAAKQDAIKGYYDTLVQSHSNLTNATRKQKKAQEQYNKELEKAKTYLKNQGDSVMDLSGQMIYIENATYDAKTSLDKANASVKTASKDYSDAKKKVNDMSTELSNFDPTIASTSMSTSASSMKTDIEGVGTTAKNTTSDIETGFEKAGTDSATKFNQGIAGIDANESGFETNGEKAGKAWVKGMKSGINAIDVTTDVRFMAPAKKLGGVYNSGMWRDIPQFATGMPYGVRGTLFRAGEAGPEIVAQGRGGSSEILNKSQIASAVYSAMTAAMANNNGGQSFDFNIIADPDKMFKVMVKKNKRNTLMTNKNAFAL